MTALALHRARFVDYDPSPITAIAFDPAAGGRTLVVGRQDGSVQVWEWVDSTDGQGTHSTSTGTWALVRTLPVILSCPTISLMVLAHPSDSTSGPRLFTAGSSATAQGDLIERSLLTGEVVHTTPLPSGPIWSMQLSPSHDVLAVATSSPHLHLLALDPDTHEMLPATGPCIPTRIEALPGKVRTLGIAFGPLVKTREQGIYKPHYIVTANSDSSLRKYSLLTGRLLGRMTVPKTRTPGNGQKKRHTVVWSVAIVPGEKDHTIMTDTIIATDSLGSVTFFDSHSLAPIKSFVGVHSGDVLSCGVTAPSSPHGHWQVFTAGVDQRIVQFTRPASLASSTLDPGADTEPTHVSGDWTLTSAKRVHKHDIRSLVVWPSLTYQSSPDTMKSTQKAISTVPLIVSGGLDCSLVVSSAADPSHPSSTRSSLKHANPLTTKGKSASFGESPKLVLSHVPNGFGNHVMSIPPLTPQGDTSSRFVLVRRSRGVGIWRVKQLAARGQRDQDNATPGELIPGGWEKVLEMNFQVSCFGLCVVYLLDC